MNKDTGTEAQKRRLKAVLKRLKEQGFSQKGIAAKTGTDTVYLSHLKGKGIIYIPNDFLEKLHETYNINPDYIRGTSDFMLDITGTKLENFEKFVESWDTVEKSENKYVHLSIDKNFYDFLIEVDKARLAAEDGISSLEEEIKRIKELFSGEADIQEFVLVPRNEFLEIVSDTVSKRKQLSDVLDLFEYADYVEDEK